MAKNSRLSIGAGSRPGAMGEPAGGRRPDGRMIHEPVRRYLTEVVGLALRCAPLPVSARQ
jgi:hypothetical protein